MEDQHGRVDLFVRSKWGEYARKLGTGVIPTVSEMIANNSIQAHLLRQITDLERRSFSYGPTTISVRQLETFSKLEDQTLKYCSIDKRSRFWHFADTLSRTGSEVQSLVRFAHANRLALHKLLKKYKKWTGSSGLGQRFQREILNTSSNLNTNFEPLVKQYIDALASVREPFNTGVQWHTGATLNHQERSKAVQNLVTLPKSRKRVPNSSAKDLHNVNQEGSRVQLDTALATIPLGCEAVRAVYWVHPDNVVQLQILLLQYTRIRNWSKSTASSRSTTNTRPSSRGSVNGQVDGCASPGGQNFGLIVCDDLGQFASRQSSEPIGDVETSPGSIAERAAASIRYSSDKDLLLAINNGSRHPEGKYRPSYQVTRFRRKSIRHLFNSSSDEECAVTDSIDDSEKSRLWLATHPNIIPLVQIQYKRSHFIGIQNTETAGTWATLDTEIFMRRCLKDSISIKDRSLLLFSCEEHPESQRFPFSVLEVRVEGPDSSGLVTMLDASHLVSNGQTGAETTRLIDFPGYAHSWIFARDSCRGNIV